MIDHYWSISGISEAFSGIVTVSEFSKIRRAHDKLDTNYNYQCNSDLWCSRAWKPNSNNCITCKSLFNVTTGHRTFTIDKACINTGTPCAETYRCRKIIKWGLKFSSWCYYENMLEWWKRRQWKGNMFFTDVCVVTAHGPHILEQED